MARRIIDRFDEQPISQVLSRKKDFIAALVGLFVAIGGSAYGAPRSSGLWWMPDVATKSGAQIDQLTYFIYYLTGAVFILTQVVYIYFLIRYRARRGVRAIYSHGDNRLEVVWTAIPTAIFIGLWGYSNHLWLNVIHREPPPDAMEIAVTAYQFGFTFQYPGPTGKLGRSDPKLISADNMFGNDPTDPATKEDLQSGVFELPVNKPVRIRLNSRDVIHGFYIPQFRIYQDAVPGRTIDWVWFIPTKIGSFQLACSQLCGSGHYNMKAQIEVVSQAEFDKWYYIEQRIHGRDRRAAVGSVGLKPKFRILDSSSSSSSSFVLDAPAFSASSPWLRGLRPRLERRKARTEVTVFTE